MPFSLEFPSTLLIVITLMKQKDLHSDISESMGQNKKLNAINKSKDSTKCKFMENGRR